MLFHNKLLIIFHRIYKDRVCNDNTQYYSENYTRQDTGPNRDQCQIQRVIFLEFTFEAHRYCCIAIKVTLEKIISKFNETGLM